MNENAKTGRAAARAQREGDHQRWTDDGGPSPADPDAPSARWRRLAGRQDVQAIWQRMCAQIAARSAQPCPIPTPL